MAQYMRPTRSVNPAESLFLLATVAETVGRSVPARGRGRGGRLRERCGCRVRNDLRRGGHRLAGGTLSGGGPARGFLRLAGFGRRPATRGFPARCLHPFPRALGALANR